MASVVSNRSLSKPFRPQDALGAASYLERVKSHLQINRTAYDFFVLQVKHWLECQGQSGSWESHRRTQQCVIEMAKILKRQPKLVYGLNALLLHGQRLECSITVEEVRYFVLVDSNGARILGTSHYNQTLQINDKSLRETVISEDRWAPFLKATSDRDWLTCISELLRYILDDPSTDPHCSRRAYRCLRELAILPPSSLIRNVEHANFPPARMAGGGYTDIYMGYLGNTRVCLRVLKPKTDPLNLAKNFCTEVLVWSRLRHPNILPFLGASTDLFTSKLCFVTPWIPNGNLMEYLKSNQDHDRYISLCEIVEGIKYLHTRDPPVAHRDIKGSNVLVRDDGVCYLADFGLSSIEEDNKLVESSPSFKGTPNWAAPEVFYPPTSGERNLRAADVYALGCTIYEVYMGVPPHWGKSPYVISELVKSETARPPLPPLGEWTDQERSLWWLVGRCWMSNPEYRPRITLIQNFLQDEGTFKPQSLPHRDLLLPSDAAAQLQESVEVLSKIKQWLDEELQSQEYFSQSQQKSTVDTSEVLQDETMTLTPAEESRGVVQVFEEPSHQPMQAVTSGMPAEPFFNQPASFARLRGLHTPDTPSIPLEPLGMQPEYEPTVGPTLTSLPQTTTVLKTSTMPTPPLTPRIHSPQCRIIGKSIVALRTEAQMFEPNINLSPRPYQTATQLPMLRPQVASSILDPINPGGFRTYSPYSNYSPSPLRHCTPSIVQPSNNASRGKDLLEGVLPTPAVLESSESMSPILHPSTRRKRSMDPSPASFLDRQH